VSCGLALDFFGLPTRQRTVAYFSFEDNRKTLHRNFAAICKEHGKSLLDLKGRVFVFDGTRSDSVIFSDQVDEYLTGLYSWVRTQAANTGAEVLVIDGIADVYAANESDRAKVKAFVRAMLRLIPLTGAVILIGHVNRDTARNPETSEGYSGSTAWHNAVRSRIYMRALSADPDANAFVAGLQKNQYGRPGFTLRVRFDATADVLVADDRPLPGTAEPEEADLDALVEIIRAADERSDPVPAASTGQRTAFHVMSVQPTFPAIFAGKKASRPFRQAIEKLRSSGRIKVRNDKGPSRHKREVFYAP
jgi:RecA-family ATPase